MTDDKFDPEDESHFSDEELELRSPDSRKFADD